MDILKIHKGDVWPDRDDVFVEKQLNATASGAAGIVFYGNPAYSGSTSGAGSISKR